MLRSTSTGVFPHPFYLYLAVVFHTLLPTREALMLCLASYALCDRDGPTSESLYRVRDFSVPTQAQAHSAI